MYKYFPTLIIGMTSGLLSNSAYKRQKNRISNFFLVICIFCIVILLYAGHHVDVFFDARNYNEMISINQLGKFSLFDEWIYNLLMVIGNYLKFDFFQFKTVLVVLCFISNYYVYKKFSTNFGLALFFYTCGTIFMDAMQLQNFIATSIFTWGFGCYINSKKKICGILYFIIGIFIASEIHTAYWISLIYLIITIKNKKTMAQIFVFFSIIVAFITIINGNSIPIVKTIMLSSSNHRFQKYALSPTRFGWIPGFVLLLIYIFIMTLIKREMILNYKKISKQAKVPNYNAQLKWVSNLYLIDLISLIIVPCNIMVTHMYRLIRNLSLIHFLCIASTLEYFSSRTVKRYLIILGTAFIIIGWFVFEYFLNSTIGDVIIPTLKGEYI